MELSQEEIQKLWNTGVKFLHNGINYTMHRMSYGDYFIEPITWKGGENDGFSSKTIWFEKFLKDRAVYYKTI